jgi:hypothetical protein
MKPPVPSPARLARCFAAAVSALVLAATAAAQSVQVTQVTTTVGGVTTTADNLPNSVFEHDLTPASNITLTTVVAGINANVISILEDGVVVRILASGQPGFPGSIAYVPKNPGAKTLTVSATTGTTTVTSASLRVNVYGIAITSPAGGTSVPVGSDLFISNSSLLRNVVVGSVQFFVNGVSIGTDTTAPYAVGWRPSVAGDYTLTARLTDSYLATVDSPPVAITAIPSVANGTMSVALANPASGSSVAAGATVAVAADATLSGTSGRVVQVQFYLDGIPLGTVLTAFPFTTNWRPALAGTYTLSAIATDDKSNTRASAPVVVTVTGNVPAVTITSPANGSSVAAGSGVSLIATASGQDGTTSSVLAVDFLVDGNVVGSGSTAPYFTTWTPVQARAQPYAITARVTATNLATSTSAPMLVTVTSSGTASTPPVVAIVAPIAGAASVTLGGSVTLAATASDPDAGGFVTSVAFYEGAQSLGLGTLAAGRYSLTWTPTTQGSHIITAVATDNAGAISISAPLTVTVMVSGPLTDTGLFVTQIYQDLLGRAPTAAELAVSSQLSAGTLTRGQFVANLVSGTGFSPAFQTLLACQVVVGVWPSYANYLAGLNALRGGTTLAAYAGALLASDEYLARYGPLPDLVTVNSGQYARVSAFATQLYQNAYSRAPTLAEVQAIFNDVSTVGVNTAVANFLTAKFIAQGDATMTARVRVAAMIAGLWRTQPNAAQVNALAAGALVSAADSVLAGTGYTGRFFTVAIFPAGLVVAPGGAAILTAEVAGNPPFAYQWYANGAPLPGATQAFLNLANVTPAQAGNYHVAVGNGESTLASAVCPVSVAPGVARLVNISTRGRVGTGDQVLIVGFVVSNGGGKPVLLRAGGPGLARVSGLGGTLANPLLRLYAGSQFYAVNDDWSSNANLSALLSATAQTGAFSYLSGSADAALLLTLNGGVYGTVVSGADGGSGLALVEAYDADTAQGGRLLNISSRATVGTGDNVLIAGFVITGNVSKRVLIRAVGPGLTGVSTLTGTLRDPRLDLFSAAGARLRGNDNWGAAPEGEYTAAAAAGAGAFALTAGSKDASLIVDLVPGLYSAIVSGVAGDTGIALVEVYDLDP